MPRQAGQGRAGDFQADTLHATFWSDRGERGACLKGSLLSSICQRQRGSLGEAGGGAVSQFTAGDRG